MVPGRQRSFSTWDWQVGIKRVLLLRAARGQAYKQRVQTLEHDVQEHVFDLVFCLW